jgi:hypothetical protein
MHVRGELAVAVNHVRARSGVSARILTAGYLLLLSLYISREPMDAPANVILSVHSSLF